MFCFRPRIDLIILAAGVRFKRTDGGDTPSAVLKTAPIIRSGNPPIVSLSACVTFPAKDHHTGRISFRALVSDARHAVGLSSWFDLTTMAEFGLTL